MPARAPHAPAALRRAALGPRWRPARARADVEAPAAPPDAAGRALRKRLAGETLARGYLSIPAPCAVVHVVYLRRGGAGESRGIDVASYGRMFEVEGDTTEQSVQEDLAHFLACVGSDVVVCDLDMCEVQSIDELVGVLDGEVGVRANAMTASELLAACDASGLRCNDFLGRFKRDGRESSVTVRFQQFTECSSLTFSVPCAPVEKQDASGRCVLGVPTDEALSLLPPQLWSRIPGDILLVMNMTVVSQNDVHAAARTAGFDTTLGYVRSRLFPAAPMGGLISGTTGDLTFMTDYDLDDASAALHVLCTYDMSDAPTDDRERFGMNEARMIQRFLELEQYRLLALIPLSDAKRLQRHMRDLDKALSSAVTSSLASDAPDADDVLLGRLVELSSECEEIGAIARNRLEAAQAYGDVVHGRMVRMGLAESEAGTRSLERLILRRLDPALRTYRVAVRQLNSTTESIARATNLLRTKTSLQVEELERQLVKLGTALSIASLAVGFAELSERQG